MPEEVIEAIKETKADKAPEYDQTVAEHFKYLGTNVIKFMTQLLNNIYPRVSTIFLPISMKTNA